VRSTSRADDEASRFVYDLRAARAGWYLSEVTGVKVELVALLAAAVVACGAGRAEDGAAKKELAKLQGAWRLVRGEEDGEPASEYAVKNLELVVKGNQFTFKGIAPLTDKAEKLAVTIDAATTPKCIDLKVETGSLKGTVLEGIYEWKGDELHLCVYWASGTRSRPFEFQTKAGSKRVLFVLKRQKPRVGDP
jgi:uncharacterized protein (TIGR03067 family)